MGFLCSPSSFYTKFTWKIVILYGVSRSFRSHPTLILDVIYEGPRSISHEDKKVLLQLLSRIIQFKAFRKHVCFVKLLRQFYFSFYVGGSYLLGENSLKFPIKIENFLSILIKIVLQNGILIGRDLKIQVHTDLLFKFNGADLIKWI